MKSKIVSLVVIGALAVFAPDVAGRGINLDIGRDGIIVPKYKVLPEGSITSNEDLQQYFINTHFYSPANRTNSTNNRLLSNLFRAVKRDPVASFAMNRHYDPRGNVGFCFGRALIAQLLARQMGVHFMDIKKISVIGRLTATLDGRSKNWRYHIATSVRDQQGEWWIIDPIFNRPLRVPEWVNSTKTAWDRSGISHYYGLPSEILAPNKILANFLNPPVDFPQIFIPHLGENLNLVNHKRVKKVGNFVYQAPLNHATYNNFFVDMVDHFRGTLEEEPSAFVADESVEMDEEPLDLNAPWVQEEEALLGSEMIF